MERRDPFALLILSMSLVARLEVRCTAESKVFVDVRSDDGTNP